jgi:DNA-binding NtrC family response regulator
VDIRLVAASNQNLEKEVADGNFREDLFYRIRVVSIYIPPLRERTQDIPQLISHFLGQALRDNPVGEKRLSPGALDHLMKHRWKGNVRELRHVIESLVLLADGETIGVPDLPPQIVGAGTVGGGSAVPIIPDDGFQLEEYLARHERNILRSALHKAGGVKASAAKLLGVNKDRMKYLCRKHAL